MTLQWSNLDQSYFNSNPLDSFLGEEVPMNDCETMKPRRLTVSSASVDSHADVYPRPWLDPMPYLRLRGRWLKQAGFDIGARVRVSIEAGKLVVEVEPPSQTQS